MRLSIESFEPEEYLLFVGISDKGKILDQEICRQFFHLRAATGKSVEISERISERLNQNLMILKKEHLEHSSEMNNGYFIQEIEKMDRWSGRNWSRSGPGPGNHFCLTAYPFPCSP